MKATLAIMQKTFIFIIPVFLSFFCFAGNGDAQYNEGLKHYKAGQFKRAAEFLEEAADLGNKQAQDMLQYSNGKKPDTSHISFEQTLQWQAQYEITSASQISQLSSEGVSSKIRRYTGNEEEIKDADTEFLFGLCYLSGLFVKEDKQKGIDLLTKSARLGHADAQAYLGMCYAQGMGVKRDLKESLFWIQASAENGSSMGQCLLAENYNSGFGIKKDKTLALKYYRLSALGGNSEGQYQYAMLLYNGKIISRDVDSAVSYFKKASTQQHVAASIMLSMMYKDGIALPRDYREAFRLAKFAADENDARGQYLLGTYYLDGIGCYKDENQGVNLLKKAAERGIPFAQTRLGQHYLMNRDGEEGLKWLKLASDNGDVRVKEVFVRILSALIILLICIPIGRRTKENQCSSKLN